MDYTLTDDQQSLQSLARQILEREATPARIRAALASDVAMDRALWSTLAEAGLLGVGVPEANGGSNGGLEELALLAIEVGRAVAPVPVLPALAIAAPAIARFGDATQRALLLGPLATGASIVTAALVDAASRDPARPATRARREGESWILDGAKRGVPAFTAAEHVLVPATTDDGVALFVVPASHPALVARSQRTSSGELHADVHLAGVRVDGSAALVESLAPAADAAGWLHELALAATCAVHLGVCERALELTRDYVRERRQFGVPIGSFQAVSHRAADCFIDVECIRWTTWQAISRLARNGRATREVAVAKFWAAEGGARVTSAAQHLHGGIGADLDYPIHRYFLWSKALELSLGGAHEQLERLGRDMVERGPEVWP
ncbi:MAG: acyl-CoA/acyl-ACP dehydrogenase [Deltaproteobacteria bacterium]|nr:acyl-CoA/acyl-ACP dehydrogenase [Deltaproteobacteria bacterium]